MIISDRGIEFLKKEEGCRLKSYKCIAGVWTIGVGHTGKTVTKDSVITEEEAVKLLLDDLKSCQLPLKKLELTQNQYDALCSLIFNIGIGAFNKSTIYKYLQAKDYISASKQFLVWNKYTNNDGKKVVSEALSNRRARERAIFDTL